MEVKYPPVQIGTAVDNAMAIYRSRYTDADAPHFGMCYGIAIHTIQNRRSNIREDRLPPIFDPGGDLEFF